MTHAQAFADQRATAYLRKGLVDMATNDQRPTVEVATDEVWCFHCEAPAVLWAVLTIGETRGYCTKHAPRVTLRNRSEDDPRVQHEGVYK